MTRQSHPASHPGTCPPHCPGSINAYLQLLRSQPAGPGAGQPVLTAAGVRFVTEQLRAAQATPHWDQEHRQFWWGARMLRAFRRPAPFQVAVLLAFQRRKWRTWRVDNPLTLLPGEGESDLAVRLLNTLKNLNRWLKPGTIRFHLDHTGDGVCWEHDHSPPAAG